LDYKGNQDTLTESGNSEQNVVCWDGSGESVKAREHDDGNQYTDNTERKQDHAHLAHRFRVHDQSVEDDGGNNLSAEDAQNLPDETELGGSTR
jgi:hypothetical protein